jgi:hypothetical protein
MKGVLAATIIALMTAGAYAQGMGMGGGPGGGKHRHGQERKAGQKKKADDANAKSPLEALPDKPYDPWRTVREPAPAPKK